MYEIEYSILFNEWELEECDASWIAEELDDRIPNQTNIPSDTHEIIAADVMLECESEKQIWINPRLIIIKT